MRWENILPEIGFLGKQAEELKSCEIKSEGCDEDVEVDVEG